MTYAIVKTGGKQYRVEQGQSLLVERLPEDDGAHVQLEPLLYVDGDTVLDGGDISNVRIEARVVAHERGPKLRVVKFKPKRGYKRRTGHRQELTRIEVTEIKVGAARSPKPAAVAEEAFRPIAEEAPGPIAEEAPGPVAEEAPGPPAEEAPGPVAEEAPGPAVPGPTETNMEEAGDGA
jgi:large subunit ribosomal protein L21